jgi:putative aminopeptidase FrvX
MLMAHVDTLGGIVSSIKGNGRLQISAIGGLRAENCEAENCRIYTRFGGTYSGTLQLCNASVHVNDDYSVKRTWDSVEVVIDEVVSSKEDVQKRTKLNKTHFEKLRVLGSLDDLPDKDTSSLIQ